MPWLHCRHWKYVQLTDLPVKLSGAGLRKQSMPPLFNCSSTTRLPELVLARSVSQKQVLCWQVRYTKAGEQEGDRQSDMQSRLKARVLISGWFDRSAFNCGIYGKTSIPLQLAVLAPHPCSFEITWEGIRVVAL